MRWRRRARPDSFVLAAQREERSSAGRAGRFSFRAGRRRKAAARDPLRAVVQVLQELPPAAAEARVAKLLADEPQRELVLELARLVVGVRALNRECLEETVATLEDRRSAPRHGAPFDVERALRGVETLLSRGPGGER